nr:uncharacterized protein LOC102910362 isoform X1 [Peromyscus maniculatus bairdii]
MNLKQVSGPLIAAPFLPVACPEAPALSSAEVTGTVGQGRNVSAADAVASVLQIKNSFYPGKICLSGAPCPRKQLKMEAMDEDYKEHSGEGPGRVSFNKSSL